MVRVLDARFAILNSNKTGVTIEAGIAHPSEYLSSHGFLSGSCCTIFSFLRRVL
jgi:hypothetical protein